MLLRTLLLIPLILLSTATLVVITLRDPWLLALIGMGIASYVLVDVGGGTDE